MEVKQITNEEEIQHLYRMRYKVFAGVNKDIPANLIDPDGLYKEGDDDFALHFGCYEGTTLLGGVSLVIKETVGYLAIEKQPFNIICEKESAEAKNLIMIDEHLGNDLFIRGKVLEGLFTEVMKAVNAHNVKYVYFISFKNVQYLYEKLGCSQIGDYQLYMEYFWVCPMKGIVENMKLPSIA